MLDDTAFDIQSWLADEIAMEFARAEGAAFVNGGAATGLGRTESTRRWSNRPRPTC
jgi:HK97 family phage major capsid protein